MQPVYKQLALGWQIAKQLSGLNPLSLGNNKKLHIKEKWSFSFVINVKYLLNRQHIKIQKFQKHLGKLKKHWLYTDYCILRKHSLLGQTTEQPLNNFGPQKLWKYKQLWGMILVAYKKMLRAKWASKLYLKFIFQRETLRNW